MLHPSRRLHRYALATAVSLGLCAPHLAAQESPAAQTSAAQEWRLPAAPLGETLNRIASQGGRALSIDPALVRGKHAPAIQGRLTPEQAVHQALTGSGLQLSSTPGGTWTLVTTQTDAGIVTGALSVQGNSTAVDADGIYREPRSLSLISRTQMDQRPARHAADILEQSSGVYSSLSQQDPGLSVNIRGIQDFGRINMNVDGMRQNFQKTGYGQRNGTMYVDPELLSGVLVEKGAVNSMGAAGTLGGVVTFRTLEARDFLEPGKSYGGKLKLGSGDNGTDFIGSGVAAYGTEAWDVLLAASERHLDDYGPGTHGDISGLRINDDTGKYDDFAQILKHNPVDWSGYTMRSRLAKLGWNPAQGQRLQLSYQRTRTETPNAGTLGNYTDDNGVYRLGWRNTGFSRITAENTALDYSLRPENNRWLDFTAKLYHVDTDDQTDVYPLSRNNYATRTRVRTWGLQAQNNSWLLETDSDDLRANYGLELFYDKINSTGTDIGDSAAGVNPGGNRALASAFANLTWNHGDWLTVQGGLRYDRYRLRGDTWMSVRTIPFTIDNPCTTRSIATCPSLGTETWTWNVDDEAGKWSPNLAVSMRPGPDWLELFANYGKGWRPPAVTETFANGSLSAGDYRIYPNPLAKPERSRSWETGFNMNLDGLLLGDDRLRAKVAYFDTRVDNYIGMSVNMVRPGYGTIANLGSAAFVNSLAQNRFRGVEYQLNYDAGFAYADLTYTHMIGYNTFCSQRAWLGGVTTISGERGNWYGIDYDEYNESDTCDRDSTYSNSSLFSSAAYLPGDRGSLTVGARAFEHRLDVGTTLRYSSGYQDKSMPTNVPYLADWPRYAVFDVYASYDLGGGWKLHGSIENIGNRAYIVSYGESLNYTLGRGRSFQGALEWHF